MNDKLKVTAKIRQDKRTIVHITNIKNDLNKLPKHLDEEGKKILNRICREVTKI